ncbi:MAG TPA: NAD(P)-binding protein [Acidimicrobiales bacterium]
MHDTDTITVVGGGLAGLIAAIECAEAGAPVRLLEARSRLGGRAVSTPEPFVANLGPHALYAGGSLWDWLVARDLHRPSRMPRHPGVTIRWRGKVRRTPPAALLRAGAARNAPAPVDVDLRTWAADRWDDETAALLSGLSGVLTFDHDPGRVSAAYVWERIRRVILAVPPAARYVEGGWSALVGRLAAAARDRGVTIETGARVTDVGELGGGPVILAVEPGAARRLLGDPTLRPESPRVALLDVAWTHRRGDPYLVLDADEAMFVTRTSAVIPTAPPGHDLVQVHAGLRPDEELADGVARIERLLDTAFPDWREREVWRRRAVVTESTGALDLPGTTWRDRTPVAYRDNVWLAGDWVAAPGHLAEVSCASAVAAARQATAALRPEAARTVA